MLRPQIPTKPTRLATHFARYSYRLTPQREYSQRTSNYLCSSSLRVVDCESLHFLRLRLIPRSNINVFIVVEMPGMHMDSNGKDLDRVYGTVPCIIFLVL
jgi:hypothetical protein